MTCRVLSQAQDNEGIAVVQRGKFERLRPSKSMIQVPVRPANTGRTDRTTPWLASEELFGDTVEIEIHHGASVYRLRKTSLGKLILTK